jgi:hypothetical protein
MALLVWLYRAACVGKMLFEHDHGSCVMFVELETAVIPDSVLFAVPGLSRIHGTKRNMAPECGAAHERNHIGLPPRISR